MNLKHSLEMKPKFEIVYRGKMFEIVTWEGKPGVKFEAAVRAPGVRLIIETEKDDLKALLMTRELRREADGYDFRLPGGKVFDSLDNLDKYRESGQKIELIAQKAAEKEGKEEAGIDSGEYSLFEVSKAGASVEWDLYYYKISNAKIGDQHLEEEELGDIETIILTSEEIFQKLSHNEIKEGRSAAMLWLWLQQNGFLKFEK
jgi:ADP-ribose pyrophosphatase